MTPAAHGCGSHKLWASGLLSRLFEDLKIKAFIDPKILDVANISHREDYRRRLDGVAYTTYILIMLLVPLKIFCRKKAGGWSNVRLDDYVSLLALALANGFFFVCIIGGF